MDELRDVIAKNLIKYRKLAKLTQAELAEKINYSDKAISKWERAEALPDISVLKQIADIYNITVEDLMSEQEAPAPTRKMSTKQHFLIALLSYVLVWFVATVIFVGISLFFPNVKRVWLAFIYAIPVGFIVVIPFSALWGNKFTTTIFVIALGWTLTLAIYLTIDLHDTWLLFLIGIPYTILALLWYLYKTRFSKKK